MNDVEDHRQIAVAPENNTIFANAHSKFIAPDELLYVGGCAGGIRIHTVENASGDVARKLSQISKRRIGIDQLH